MEVQVFGIRKSAETRAALRFFAERRVKTHFVDFAVRAPSRGELHRFAQKFGVARLIDQGSRRFVDLGWGAARYDDETWLDRLAAEPLALNLPLARYQHQLTVGPAESVWRTWS